MLCMKLFISSSQRPWVVRSIVTAIFQIRKQKLTEINQFNSHQSKMWKYHDSNPLLPGTRDCIPDHTVIPLKTILQFKKIISYQRGT